MNMWNSSCISAKAQVISSSCRPCIRLWVMPPGTVDDELWRGRGWQVPACGVPSPQPADRPTSMRCTLASQALLMPSRCIV